MTRLLLKTGDELARGEVTLRELRDRAGADHDVYMIRVAALLRTLPGTAEADAQASVERLGFAQSRRLGSLTDDELAAVEAELDRLGVVRRGSQKP